MRKKIILLAFIALSAFTLSACVGRTEKNFEGDDPKTALLWLFHDPDCPHCRDEKKFLAEMKKKYPGFTMAQFNIRIKENSQLYNQMAQAYAVKTGGVPITYIGGQSFVGYADYIGEQIEEQIQKCLEAPCASPGDKLP